MGAESFSFGQKNKNKNLTGILVNDDLKSKPKSSEKLTELNDKKNKKEKNMHNAELQRAGHKSRGVIQY